MSQLRILIVEDSENDALLMLMHLKRAGYDPVYQIIETAKEFKQELYSSAWDIIITDYVLPEFDGLEALKILHTSGLDIPCVIVSGKIDEETAVTAMKAGAKDYIMKDNLNRLVPAVKRELEEAEIRLERKKTEEKLKQSEEYFQAIIENTQDAIMVVNTDGAIRYMNPATQILSGYQDKEFVGQNIYNFLHLEDAAHVRKAFNHGIAIPDYTERLEVRLKHKSGVWRNVEVIGRNALQKTSVNGYILNIRDITERQQIEQERQYYAQKVVQVQEEERKRIARELHDDTAQNLALMSLEIDSLLNSQEKLPDKISAKLKQLKENTSRLSNDVRRYSHALRPGVLDLGLEPAIEQLVAETRELSGLDIRFDPQGVEASLSEEVELALFRIAQEAVNNIRKHSQATMAVVEIEYTAGLIKMVIADNGKGFNTAGQLPADKEKGGLGLIGMRERAGLAGANLKIDSAPGKGTTVTVEVKI